MKDYNKKSKLNKGKVNNREMFDIIHNYYTILIDNYIFIIIGNLYSTLILMYIDTFIVKIFVYLYHN